MSSVGVFQQLTRADLLVAATVNSGVHWEPLSPIDLMQYTDRGTVAVGTPVSQRCCSARGLRADRRHKLLKWLDTAGSELHAEQHPCPRSSNVIEFRYDHGPEETTFL